MKYNKLNRMSFGCHTRCEVVYKYEGRRGDELSLEVGDLVEDVVRQDGGVGVALVRLDLDVEMVCEHLLGLACCEKQMEDTEEDGTDSLVVTEGGGKGVARPPPSLTARWEG